MISDVLSDPLAVIKKLTVANGHDAEAPPAILVRRRVNSQVNQQFEQMHTVTETAREAIDELGHVYSYAECRSAATLTDVAKLRHDLIPAELLTPEVQAVFDSYTKAFLGRVALVADTASDRIVQQAEIAATPSR